MHIEEFVTQGLTRAGWVGDEGGGHFWLCGQPAWIQIPALPPASQVIFSYYSFLCVSVSSSVKWETKIVSTKSSLAAQGLGL